MDGWMEERVGVDRWMDGWMEAALIFKLDSIPNSIYYLLALSKSLNLIFLTCSIAIMISSLLPQCHSDWEYSQGLN